MKTKTSIFSNMGEIPVESHASGMNNKKGYSKMNTGN